MAVVLAPDGRRVLLLRREIFVLWDLPGGKIERGETPVDAVVRETREETGLEIAIDREVGRYLSQSVYGRGEQLTHVYRARVAGGKPKRFGFEVTELRWFGVEDLPRGLQPLHRQMVADALAAQGAPVERTVPFSRWKLYPARIVFPIAAGFNNSLRWVFRGFRRE
jgi:8-oxo-dGTP pyrophosphatase MutT (NUDIX family)